MSNLETVEGRRGEKQKLERGGRGGGRGEGLEGEERNGDAGRETSVGEGKKTKGKRCKGSTSTDHFYGGQNISLWKGMEKTPYSLQYLFQSGLLSNYQYIKSNYSKKSKLSQAGD